MNFLEWRNSETWQKFTIPRGGIGTATRIVLTMVAAAIITTAYMTGLVGATNVLILILIVPICLGTAAVIVRLTKPRKSRHRDFIWRNPLCYCLSATVAMLVAISTLATIDTLIVFQHTIRPHEAKPWQENLAVKALWKIKPSAEAEEAVQQTATLLGFRYERVWSENDANLKILGNSFAFQCRWLALAGIARLESDPSQCGSKQGEVHLCKWRSLLAKKSPPENAVLAHEMAHILAAQEHFGDGLMGAGGGTLGKTEFSEDEISTMRERIKEFHEAVPPECARDTPKPIILYHTGIGRLEVFLLIKAIEMW
ncbi:MAG: hypothetical protein OXL37_12085 [Chloroflexota bacterium]|nr:hypothetical protein [Chloroflexota bacterium]MDE2962182.1 hypothetical protein [Chloroflexota bacterium]